MLIYQKGNMLLGYLKTKIRSHMKLIGSIWTLKLKGFEVIIKWMIMYTTLDSRLSLIESRLTRRA